MNKIWNLSNEEEKGVVMASHDTSFMGGIATIESEAIHRIAYSGGHNLECLICNWAKKNEDDSSY